MGGTVLGSSRGGFDLNRIVDSIVQNGVNQVYVIGGDGTVRGAATLSEECRRRKLQVTVASIPKTIDNDIPIIDKSFGFDTAVQEASKAIDAAHTEVSCFPNGVGIVKLMGRNSGFIALHASLSSREVDCCLIPEVPFVIHGRGGLIEYIHKCLIERGKMVLVVAEGAGQEYVRNHHDWIDQLDASGNKKLGDIGHFLYQEIESTFKKQGIEVSMKYIDPTYMIRAVASNASDNIYCTLLAHSAVHGSFAGYTGFTVGPIHGRHAYIPMTEIVTAQKQVDLRDRMWSRLVNSTGQPDFSPRDIPKGFQGPCIYSREEESFETTKTVDKGFPGETP
ncbi:6-phosphofructokinase [Galdieria sulphuraria]|nr:6-phosphofructokinase [Galdieria sulphuraria]EME32540.1 6-phosphofructokinase [Galdieria sulphuraria]|eukprot:XP_005709060.1 6-phosphofructokinase [Galdieria sulphuraria]